MSLCRTLFWLAAVSLLGCSRGGPAAVVATPEVADGPAWFVDVTDEVGIDFRHDSGPKGEYPMPQIVGSGCAVFDCDSDGRLDLLFLTNGGPESESKNRLYRQKDDGKFEDISAGSGVDFPGHNMGVATGDLDGDGRVDLIITQFVGTRVLLNRGGSKFADVTEASGLKNPLWATSAAIFDFDRDGRFDVAITNYVDFDPSWPCTSPSGGRDFCAPKTFAGTSSKLFRNVSTATELKFEDVSLASGIGKLPGPGLGIFCADLTGDDWPDIFVANDGKPNRLWVNKQNGRFEEEGISRGVAYTGMGEAFAGMGIAAGDVDDDGLIDLYVTHLTSETNTLWKQDPAGLFRDRTTEWNLKATSWRGTGFGTVFRDFDSDGKLDLAMVNGRVAKGPPRTGTDLTEFWQPYGERNQLLTNTGKGFGDISKNSPALCGEFNVARGIASGDLDGNGRVDLVVTTIDGRARILRNVAKNANWLQIQAKRGNRDDLGAKVTVQLSDRKIVRVMQTADSFLSASSPMVHFGLGERASFTGIDVTWSDGSREKFPKGEANRTFTLTQGTGTKQ